LKTLDDFLRKVRIPLKRIRAMKQRTLSIVFSLAVFLSAFLLFQIQPLISKSILPWFGGTPNVWTTCLLFFQTVLFGGYVYAHVLTQKFSPKWQAIVHTLLLLLAVVLLGIVPDESWKPTGEEAPVLRILGVLVASVGLPYFVLSTTGPLLQAWFGGTCPGKSPYRLYALSNIGSLLALLSFPFFFEPMIVTSELSRWWMMGFIALAALCSLCGWIAAFATSKATDNIEAQIETNNTPVPATESTSTEQTGGNAWQWFGLSMTASVLLLATTNQVCQDVAVIPFLWVVPLSLYLLTFILCFDSDRWYSRLRYGMFGALATALVAFVMISPGGVSIMAQLVIYFGALFLCCMVCHGELAALKPEPKRLTRFYLTMSAGGAAGGIFVAVIAPLIFPLYLEMHIAIAVCITLTVGVYLNENKKRTDQDQIPFWGHLSAAAAVILVMFSLQSNASGMLQASTEVERSFYGVLRVEHQFPEDLPNYTINMRHGRILHGVQFVQPEKSRIPTTYFGHDAGVGRAFAALRDRDEPLKVGIVGLGIGTLSAYSEAGDEFRYYEINESVVRIAEKHFTFVSGSPAKHEMVIGDARLMMEREDDQKYDLLILDAFSGDSVPAHLLTQEVMQQYKRHVKDDGILAMHISNLHFDLSPVTAAMVEDANFEFVLARGIADDASAQVSNLWMLSSRDETILKHEAIQELAKPDPGRRVLWTDDFSNLLSVLK